MFAIGEWVSIGLYQVRVQQVKDGFVNDSDKRDEKFARSVRLLVEYANHTDEALTYSQYHWKLYDTEGYNYPIASYNGYYADDVRRRLREGVLTKGQVVKGWLAFNPSAEAVTSFVRFTTPGFTNETADVAILGAVPKKPTISPVKQSWWQRLWGQPQGTAVVKPTSPLPQLVPGTRYKVLKPFEDFHGRMFVPGDILTFVNQQPPYLGLHILEFQEAMVHLHAEQNGDIIGRLFDYLG